MSFTELMESFVLDPNGETLKPLQGGIMEAVNYDPLVLIEPVISPLVSSGDHQGAVDALWQMMPGVFLSPTAHVALAYSYTQLGDEKAARREGNLARLALATLMNSGSGTEEAAYRVLRVNDEYDVLRGLNRNSVEQRTLTREGRGYDVHRCADDSEVWFDLLWQAEEA